MKWGEIAAVLTHVARELRAEWGATLPPVDSLPSAALEAEIDGWCARLAAALHQPLPAPPAVQPWVLARLASMATTARVLARQGDTDAPRLSRTIVKQFLIDEWHGVLRDRWCLQMGLRLGDEEE